MPIWWLHWLEDMRRRVRHGRMWVLDPMFWPGRWITPLLYALGIRDPERDAQEAIDVANEEDLAAIARELAFFEQHPEDFDPQRVAQVRAWLHHRLRRSV